MGYPPELPISARTTDIAAAIRDHQVVIVSGETGSGKSTQLPKICLELGRGLNGLIGHTQPRRIAARSVAARIAEELRVPLGSEVGYKIRFTDSTNPRTYIKLMTDGILLAESQLDRRLDQYDTIIVDELHRAFAQHRLSSWLLEADSAGASGSAADYHFGHDRR